MADPDVCRADLVRIFDTGMRQQLAAGSGADSAQDLLGLSVAKDILCDVQYLGKPVLHHNDETPRQYPPRSFFNRVFSGNLFLDTSLSNKYLSL